MGPGSSGKKPFTTDNAEVFGFSFALNVCVSVLLKWSRLCVSGQLLKTVFVRFLMGRKHFKHLETCKYIIKPACMYNFSTKFPETFAIKRMSKRGKRPLMVMQTLKKNWGCIYKTFARKFVRIISWFREVRKCYSHNLSTKPP